MKCLLHLNKVGDPQLPKIKIYRANSKYGVTCYGNNNKRANCDLQYVANVPSQQWNKKKKNSFFLID